jgi:hypothetical protein
MRSGLEALVAHLEHLGRTHLLECLRPGLPRKDLVRQLEARGFEVPAELADLYGWRDGTDLRAGAPLDDVHLFPGFYFLSLEQAMVYAETRPSEAAQWGTGWLPLFTNGGGDFFLFDSGRSEVRHSRIDSDEQPVEYTSLEAMIATLNECFERDIFFVDERGYLEADDGRWLEVAARSR